MILAQGFRPFFLAAGVWAIVGVVVPLGGFFGWLDPPTAGGPLWLHFHELLFGYAAAAMAGFLLTAIPNWTRRLPLRGWRLLALVVVWLAGRAAMLTSGWIGVGPAAAVDLAFLAVLGAVTLREIVAGRNWRNLPVVALIFVFLAVNAMTHADLLGWIDAGGRAPRLAIAVPIFLIALIGGRIVPSFTRNWLAKRDEEVLPAPFGVFDRLTLAVTAGGLLGWAIAPDNAVSGAVAMAAAVMNAGRLARWRGHRTVAEPLLWVLHLGYLWIPIGFGLAAASAWSLIPANAPIHAFAVGAIGTMTVAVMSRATLGHSGRELTASPSLTAAFVLITVAAIARIGASLIDGVNLALLTATATAWVAGFFCYLFVCWPMFWGDRFAKSDR